MRFMQLDLKYNAAQVNLSAVKEKAYFDRSEWQMVSQLVI